MVKNIIKILMMILGNGILIFGIISETNDITKIVFIVFGLIFSIVGSCLSFESNNK